MNSTHCTWAVDIHSDIKETIFYFSRGISSLDPELYLPVQHSISMLHITQVHRAGQCLYLSNNLTSVFDDMFLSGDIDFSLAKILVWADKEARAVKSIAFISVALQLGKSWVKALTLTFWYRKILSSQELSGKKICQRITILQRK